VENGRVELRGLGSSWNLSQELDSVGLGAEDVGSGLRARAAEGLERTGNRESGEDGDREQCSGSCESVRVGEGRKGRTGDGRVVEQPKD
jgi:hypothetical protein